MKILEFSRVSKGFDDNPVLRDLTEADLRGLFDRLDEIGMAQAGTELARDVVACPGADTCNLAVTQSRGLASDIDRALEDAGLAEVGFIHASTPEQVHENAAAGSRHLIEAELVAESKNDYEYLLIEDMKPAGFEAVDVRSGYVGDVLNSYLELRDERAACRCRGRGTQRSAGRA